MFQSREITANHAIGLFDSGIGGLTVMRQVMQMLPRESLVYFGDTARIPYGEKSPKAILNYSLENAAFLMLQKIKLLVVACHTASAFAEEHLSQQLSLPVVGVVEPGIEKALQVSKGGAIAVLGTRGTISSQVYEKAIHAKQVDKEVVSVACPLLVHLVEERWHSHAATRLIVQEYLRPLKSKLVDTVLLGCTHYPLLQDLIQEELGPHVAIVDSAKACAEQISQVLREHKLYTSQDSDPWHRYFVSDQPTKFQEQAQDILKLSIDNVELCTIQ